MTAATTNPRTVVLLVDDEPELLHAMRQGLEPEFQVETASTAQEAERLLSSGRHRVIVSDHLMPGEEGLKFLVRAAERYPTTKRILLTGYINPELISRSVAVAKLSACLVKPVHAADIAKAIRAAMAQR